MPMQPVLVVDVSHNMTVHVNCIFTYDFWVLVSCFFCFVFASSLWSLIVGVFQKNVDEAVMKLKSKGIEAMGLECHVSLADHRKRLMESTVEVILRIALINTEYVRFCVVTTLCLAAFKLDFLGFL